MRYRPSLPLALTGFNLHIRPHERIAIVGRTGAGKSSIINALFRTSVLSAGEIQIDGIDISTLELLNLRRRLAIVPQDPTLLEGTIRSNLDPFGEVDDAKLWNALQEAGLVPEAKSSIQQVRVEGYDQHGTSSHSSRSVTQNRTSMYQFQGYHTTGLKEMRPPSGSLIQSGLHLDTLVKADGRNLSLGQRQLLAFARAIVRDAKIVICDEATSNIDVGTDKRIQDSMAKIFRNKTVICIAHRLQTILTYDRVVVMREGKIDQLGPPSKLWECQGTFRSMCDQAGIVIGDFSPRDNLVMRDQVNGK